MQINDEKPFRFKSVSNFSIEVIQHMHDENFPKKLIRVKNIYNNERIFDYRADALVATQDVRKMLANQGNFKWKGDADNLENLKAEVIRLDAMYGHENIKVVKTIEYTVDVTISDDK